MHVNPADCRREVSESIERSGSSWGEPLVAELVARSMRRAALRGFVASLPEGALAWVAQSYDASAGERDLDRLYGAFAYLEDPAFFERPGWEEELTARREASRVRSRALSYVARFASLWLTRAVTKKLGRRKAQKLAPLAAGIAGAVTGAATARGAAHGAVAHYEELAAPTSRRERP
jgi:hypothetical protein